MRVLRAADHRRMAWKNGGGETIEIAVFPDGASLDDFDWRVSMATVVESGAFSLFPGVDRSLSILDGQGILLSVEGLISKGLTKASEPLTFPADVATKATLSSGPVTDLNVMTRRGRWSHSVERLRLSGGLTISTEATVTIVLCLSGSAHSRGCLSVSPLDAVILEHAETDLEIQSDDDADLALIRLQKHGWVREADPRIRSSKDIARRF